MNVHLSLAALVEEVADLNGFDKEPLCCEQGARSFPHQYFSYRFSPARSFPRSLFSPTAFSHRYFPCQFFFEQKDKVNQNKQSQTKLKHNRAISNLIQPNLA